MNILHIIFVVLAIIPLVIGYWLILITVGWCTYVLWAEENEGAAIIVGASGLFIASIPFMVLASVVK